MGRLVWAALVFLSAVIFASAPSTAADFRIGVAPSVVDLGTVVPGSVQEVSFSVITPSTDPLLVSLVIERGSLDFFANPSYSALVDQYSEEDVTPWVTFIENPFEVSLSDSPGTLNSRGSKPVKFLVSVPEDAEPGYHTLKVVPVPGAQGEAAGTGATNVVAITTVTVIFNVPGQATRSGEISSIVQGNYAGTRLEVSEYFENTGTVTMSARADQSLYRGGDSIENTSSSRVYVEPGATANLPTFFQGSGLEPGEYSLQTRVVHHTGAYTRNATIVVSEPPPEPVSVQAQGWGWDQDVPAWAIALMVAGVITISILIYKWYK